MLTSSRALGLPLALVLSSCGGSSPPRPVPNVLPTSSVASPKASPAERTLAIGDEVVDDLFAESPSTVAMLRIPGARYDQLPEDSLSSYAARQEREDRWRAELAGIDRAALGETPAGLTHDIVTETLDARKQARVCRNELWAVRQMGGFQVGFADLAQAQPVGTADYRQQAIARFSRIPAYVTTQIANLREGLRLGYAQSEVNVPQVLEQLDRLTQGAPEASPYSSPAERDGDPELRAKWSDFVVKELDPALLRYRAFLHDEYLPRARKTVGVSGNPDGAACYVAAIRASTTLPLTPEQVHQAGLAELARIEGEMTALAAKSFDKAPVRTLLDRFAKDPAYAHKDAASVTRQANDAIARAKKALPRAFGILPTGDVAVEPIPRFQERTAAAHYLVAALDGSRPAAYRIRLYQAEKQSIVLGESTAFHETVPGHHLQINIANGRATNPRVARFLFNSGFSEGWALYAERLADELGLYSDDASRFGMLSNAAWRACRLIVDTGLHAFGWTRERAIALLLEHTAITREQAAQEVDRYISWPGQATAYMTGYLEIARLRAEAERAFGKGFDLRQFHDRVLEQGAVPLPVLRRHVERWITTSAPG